MPAPENNHILPEAVAPTVTTYFEVGDLYSSFNIDMQAVSEYLTDRGLSDHQINALAIDFDGQGMSDEEKAELGPVEHGIYLDDEKRIGLHTVSTFQVLMVRSAMKMMDQNPGELEQAAEAEITRLEENLNETYSDDLTHELEHYIQDCVGQTAEQAAFYAFEARKLRNFRIFMAAKLGGLTLASGGIGYAGVKYLPGTPLTGLGLGGLSFTTGLTQLTKHISKRRKKLDWEMYNLDPAEHHAHGTEGNDHAFISVALTDTMRQKLFTIFTDTSYYDKEK